MDVVINELSFIQREISAYTAEDLLKQFTQLILKIRQVHGSMQLYRHSRFRDCEISPGHSVYSFIKSLKDQKIRSLILELVTKGPYVDTALDEQPQYHGSSFNDRDVTSSSLAFLAWQGLKVYDCLSTQPSPVPKNPFFQGVLLSLKDMSEFSSQCIQVRFTTDDKQYHNVNMCNVTEEGQIETLCRPYQPTGKHQEGGWGTFMNLKDNVAQKVLIQGIQKPNGKQIYGYYDELIYEFQPDGTGGFPGKTDTYHGYPIPASEVPPQVLEIMKNHKKVS